MISIGKEYIDDLTGLYNRRYLNEQIPKRLKGTQRKDMPLSIVLIDLDHFKNVNDTYGHTRGDVVLKEFALFLKALLRAHDMVFRYGGDEFVCTLADTDYEQAVKISERFIEQCRTREFSQIRLTMSIGIASCPKHAKDWPVLFEIADRNLYSAKRHGRDRVGVFEKEKKVLHIPTPEIIGRDEEIARIKDFINPIFKGHGAAVCISGEIGVGKTRLVYEIIRNHDFQDIQFLKSNLSATTKSIPYYPFREIIREVIKKEGEASVFEIPQAYQIELVKILPELSSKSKKADRDIFMLDKFRLFEGVRRFLALQASKAPLFVCLDNIHWADDSSVELFHYLIRVLKGSPIIFFFVYRVEKMKDSVFQSALQLMTREDLYKGIELEPLKTADVARMLSLMIDAIPSSELTEYIFKETGGNPFFIEELMKSIETNGALVWNKDEWIFDREKKTVIPYSVEGVIDRKLGMMDKEACDLLECTAVIGRGFDFSFLRDITKMNEGHLFDLIDEILGMKLLKESGGEQYCFSEEIIREIVYQRINKVKLKRYHQTIGEKLLSLHKDRIKEVVEELAHHFYISGDQKRTVKYSTLAADRAKHVYSNKDAIRFYTWAIESLSKSTIKQKETKEIECLRKRAKVLNLIGENEKAISDLDAAIEKAKKINSRKHEADCLVEVCKFHLDIAQYDHVLEKADIALKIYKHMGNREGEANSLNDLGIVYANLGKYEKALQFYQHSLKIRKEISDRKGESASLNNIGVVHHCLGRYSNALKFFQNSLKIDEELGDLIGIGMSFSNIGASYKDLYEYSKALKFHNRALRINDKTGDSRAKAMSFNNIGLIQEKFGKYSNALNFYERSYRIAEDVGERRVQAACLTNSGQIYTYIGEYSEALKSYQNSLKIAEEMKDRPLEAVNHARICWMLFEQNNLSLAEKHCNRARSIAKKIGSKAILADVSIVVFPLYLKRNDLVKARNRLKEIMSLVDELDLKEATAEALCLSGRLLTKQKKWAKAKSSFEKSFSIFKQIKSKLGSAKILYYQSLMFKESGDKSNVKKYSAKAMRIFRQLSAKGWIEKQTYS